MTTYENPYALFKYPIDPDDTEVRGGGTILSSLSVGVVGGKAFLWAIADKEPRDRGSLPVGSPRIAIVATGADVPLWVGKQNFIGRLQFDGTVIGTLQFHVFVSR